MTIRNFTTFLSFIVLLMLFYNCSDEQKPTQIDRGKLLAELRCSSCHEFPKPGLLPKATWQDYILPRMGYMLGIYEKDSERKDLFEEGPAKETVEASGLFPETPQIAPKDWAAIQAYYLEVAPTQLPHVDTLEIIQDLPQFTVEIPETQLSPPSTTMVSIRPNTGGLILGDANTQSMYLFDKNLQLEKTAKTREGAVQVQEFANSFVLTVMGSFSPTDAPSGLVFALPKQNDIPPKLLIEGLQRPVHNTIADLNQDQQPEFIISEFGKWTGRLAYWSLDAQGLYQVTLLKQQAGATRSIVYDLNQDGKDDIVTLFGQGAEGIYAFYQQADGTFREDTLLTFPATYGSSYFDLLDLDADGDMDIVYTNGDNADYPPVLKSYHGIRYYTNDGDNRFTESFFYPLPGAYKAITRDFDGDGYVDIAAISFFPDFENQAEQSFIFLENQGNDNYQARTFPEVNKGRWITMDAGDIDLDGDLDLVLGALTFEVVPEMGLVKQWTQDGIPFLVLKNNAIR
ncbi:MAG: VCBS repeat-containing protein [Bacteroidota bacterium]